MTRKKEFKEEEKMILKQMKQELIEESSIFSPSQGLQAPRYIQACPLPTNSLKDSFCSD